MRDQFSADLKLMMLKILMKSS